VTTIFSLPAINYSAFELSPLKEANSCIQQPGVSFVNFLPSPPLGALLDGWSYLVIANCVAYISLLQFLMRVIKRYFETPHYFLERIRGTLDQISTSKGDEAQGKDQKHNSWNHGDLMIRIIAKTCALMKVCLSRKWRNFPSIRKDQVCEKVECTTVPTIL